MRSNSLKSLIVAVLTAVICLSSCGGLGKLRELKLTSVKVEKLVPEGLRSVSLYLNAGISNPGAQVNLSDFSCDLKHNGKVLGVATFDPFTIKAKAEETYSLKTEVSIGNDMNLMSLGSLLKDASLDNMFVDISFKATLKNGVSKKLEYKDLPLKQLLETAKNEN